MCEKGKIPLGTSLGPKGKQLHAGAIKAEAAFCGSGFVFFQTVCCPGNAGSGDEIEAASTLKA